MRPLVVVVSHTHWDREWYQPFEVFRLRLGEMVEELLDLLDRDPRFAHFMLDGQTVCVDDLLAQRPALGRRLASRIAEGRIGIGPWYVLQDELLVGAESIVRNLAEGLRGARRLGVPMRVGYLPDAFGHVANMPRILRGFDIEAAVVWRGVGDGAPGSEWRWRAPGGAEVLCLYLPGGYGNAHGVGKDAPAVARARLDKDLAALIPQSRAATLLWMNGNDHQRAEPGLPDVLEALARERPDIDLEHASLERAARCIRERVRVAELPVVDGELRRASATVPVLSGVWSSRIPQKRDHDEAQALLARFVEPFVALARPGRREALDDAWRQLLRCQPHDSICGCSVDEVHRELTTRLAGVDQLGRALVAEAAQALAGSPTADFTLHQAIAILNPHPFVASGRAEVWLQRHLTAMPFRLVGPTGELPYQIVARWPSEGPDRAATAWLRLRVDAEALPPHGLRLAAIVPGPPAAAPSRGSLTVRAIAGGIEIADPTRGLRITHTFEDEDDRGDLYDFCPREGTGVCSSRDADLGVRVTPRVVDHRVEIEVDIDNRRPDHRLRARFEVDPPSPSLHTETAFGWLERTTPGTHPTAGVTVLGGGATTAAIAIAGPGLHEVERGADGALRLTLLRATGWMSRGDLTTRPGHAGYNVPVPDAQLPGTTRLRYAVAIGDDPAQAVRAVDPGVLPPRAVALERAEPGDRAFLSLEPASVRLSIWKRADDGDGDVLRLIGAPGVRTTAQLRFARPIAAALLSDLDERRGAPLAVTASAGGALVTVDIEADDVVTLRTTPQM